MPQAADEVDAQVLALAPARQIDDARGVGAPFESGVELAEVRRHDRALARPVAVVGRAVAEPSGGVLLAPRADSVADVVAVQHERSAGLVDAPDGHVDVRMGRVVMVDGDPFEARPEVGFHGREERPGVLPEVEPIALLGRHDHLPQAPIARPLPGVEAPLDRDVIAVGIESLPALALALGPFARQIAAVGAPMSRRAVGRVADLHEASLAPTRGAAGAQRALRLGTSRARAASKARAEAEEPLPSMGPIAASNAARPDAKLDLIRCQLPSPTPRVTRPD